MPEAFDARDFWEPVTASNKDYVEAPLSAETVAAVEKALAYRLPAAYVALARSQNGGVPRRRCHRTAQPTRWARDHVAIRGIYGIGAASPSSLAGPRGSRFWMAVWDYPEIGVYFADTPSGGHAMLCLDYRACGRGGEPAVVYVDQTAGFKVTPVAPGFEAFIRGLEPKEAFGPDQGEGGDA